MMENKKLKSLLFCAVVASAILFMFFSRVSNSRVEQPTQDSLVKSIKEKIGITSQANLDHKRLAVNEKQIPHLAKQELEPVKNKQELEGRIKNEYGIRDDVLRFIEQNVPADNKEAVTAAIKLAQYDNQTYYHSANAEEAVVWARKGMLALRCLRQALPKVWVGVAEGMGKLMHNNSDRDKYMWDVDEKYFGWKVLGTGLTESGERKKCEAGDF